MFERWLIAKVNVFAPNWETLINLVSKLKEEKWLVGKGTAYVTVEKGEPNTETIPDTIERAWFDDESREELRMVWKVEDKSPLAGAASSIEIHRAPDFVYPIRKSIGARRSDIVKQFLAESTMLSLCGGAIGITIAYLLAKLVAVLTPVPTALPLVAVSFALAVSASVGLVSGVYPAWRAARLDPIEALRAD